MKQIIRLIFMAAALHLASFPVIAGEPGSSNAATLISDAHKEKKAGNWDRAEILYLKAAKSPDVGRRISAYKGLRDLYRTLKLEKKAAKAESKLAAEIEFQKRLIPEGGAHYQLHKVKKGETYGKLAAKYGISQKWLTAANQSKTLIEGKSIKIPKSRDAIVVDKSEKKLFWKRGSEVIKVYPVSVGRVDMETPEGKFKIINKIPNPVWYHNKKAIPPESPENLLGTRWLGLDKKSYGIHGTRDPDGIGSAVSHGCVRMHNHHVEELFEWVPVGTPVTIRTGK